MSKVEAVESKRPSKMRRRKQGVGKWPGVPATFWNVSTTVRRCVGEGKDGKKFTVKGRC